MRAKTRNGRVAKNIFHSERQNAKRERLKADCILLGARRGRGGDGVLRWAGRKAKEKAKRTTGKGKNSAHEKIRCPHP